MAQNLSGKRIAILATDGFEQSELTEPLKALKRSGAKVEIVAPHGGEIQGMKHHDKGDKVKVDRTLDEARPEEYDALVLPGGVANPDQLRTIAKAVAFARHFFERQEAGRRDLPRTLVAGRGRCGARPRDDVMAVAQDRSQERRRALGRSRGGGGSRPRHQPQARRSPGLLRQDDRGVRRRPPRAAARGRIGSERRLGRRRRRQAATSVLRKQAGDGHRADAARHRRDRAGDASAPRRTRRRRRAGSCRPRRRRG